MKVVSVLRLCLLKRKFKCFCFFVIILFSVSCVSLKTQKELSEEYFNLGNDYFDLENYSRATDLYLKALSYNKNSKNATINLIMAYQNNKKYDDAEKLIVSKYEEKTDEYNKKLILLLGKNYFLTNNFSGAINLFKEYINTYPNEVAGFYNLGLSFLKIGDATAALENFLKAYEIDKNFVPVLYNVSNYYYNELLYKEALPYVTALSQKESNNDMVLYMYAKILYELSEYETSLEYAKKCYTIDTKNKDYYLLTAKIYAKGFEDKKNTFYFIDKTLEAGYKPSELAEVEEFSVIKETYKNEYNELLKKYIK